MLLSLNWLKEFVPYEGTAQELGDKLTMLGLELEGIHHPFADIMGIVTGRVLTCENHPDSDHLHVCTVDVGSAGEGVPLNIVCGAPNVAAGQLVSVAMVGVTLPGGLTIKKAKLRGQPSEGMICSERELGITEDHSGILVLPETDFLGRPVHPGQNFVETYVKDREVLEISITPNRADCLSVLGFAREVAAACNLPLTRPEVILEEQGADIGPEIPVEIAIPDFCPAYLGRVIENAQVYPSPLWMRCRLHAVGFRAISNLVDVTNYIMMELGQPMHAFDRDKLEGSRIRVAPATEGEVLTTLDGQDRTLAAGDGLICDAVRPVAVAGVMGGLATEITEESRSVFLECAVFYPPAVRRTGRRLGLSSESAYRYERGVDQTGMAYALDRAAALMAELSGGKIRTGVSMSEPKPWQPEWVRFRPSRAQFLLGVEVSPEFCAATLESLGCQINKRSADDWLVAGPGCRYDLSREADFIEEVARYVGVDSIPATLPAIAQNMERYSQPESTYEFISRLKHWGAGLGLNEAINYSFVSNKELDRLGMVQEGRVHILNPLTAEQDVLRPELAPGLLQNVRLNIAQGAAGVRLFEVANSFHGDVTSETTVRERLHLAIALHGNRHDSAWPRAEADMDYTDLKGIVEHLFLTFLRMPLPKLVVLDNHPYLAPAVGLMLEDGEGPCAGIMGRLKPQLADDYHARKDVWLADCDMALLREAAAAIRHSFTSLPVFPHVRRDMTVIVPDETGLKVEDVLQTLEEQSSSLLESVQVLDIYQPKDAKERNITFRFTFRKQDGTLQDKDVDKEREKLGAALVRSLPVRI